MRKSSSLRPLPVFAGQAVESELLDAQAGRFFGDAAHRGDAVAVPFDARQAVTLCPAPVAVHDHGDVSWTPLTRDVERVAGGLEGCLLTVANLLASHYSIMPAD